MAGILPSSGGLTPVTQDPSNSSSYPVFGQDMNKNLPDPSVYTNAIGSAFNNIAGSLKNSWGALAAQNQQAQPQAQGSPVRQVNYGMTPAAQSPQNAGQSDPLSREQQVSWYGSPWLYMGAKNGMNQFSNQMKGLDQSRPKDIF